MSTVSSVCRLQAEDWHMGCHTCLLPDIIHLSFSEVCIYLDISKIVVKVLRLCFIWCNWGFVKLFSLCFWVQQRHYLQLSRIHIGIHKLWVEDQQNIHKNIKAVYNRRTFSFKYFLKLLKLMHFQAVAEVSSEQWAPPHQPTCSGELHFLNYHKPIRQKP